MTSVGASSPLCSSEAIIHVPQSQSLDSPLPDSTTGPPAQLHTETSQKATRGLFVGSLRAGGEGGAVQKGHCSLLSSLAGSNISVRSRCIPHLELAGCLASHLPRGPALWRSHPNHNAPSMRYLGIQHQKRLSLESSKSSASSMNGLSCECWGGESVFALIIISHSFSLSFSTYFYKYVYINSLFLALNLDMNCSN